MNFQPLLVASVAEAGPGACYPHLAPADRPARSVGLRRADRVLWPRIAHLFPEFTLAARRIWRNAGTVRFAPGLLQGPRFNLASSWVSGTLVDVSGQSVWAAQILRTCADAATRGRAMALVGRMASARVGGRFWAPLLPDGPERIILRAASPDALLETLPSLLRAHEAATILVLSEALPAAAIEPARRAGVDVVSGAVDPWSVLARARGLYVSGDDELALLGRMLRRPVICHTPGLATGVGEHEPDAAALAAALLLSGARYGDPRTGQRIDVDAAISLLAEWRSVTDRNRTVGCCVGVAFWKRRRLAAFFHDGQSAPRFCRSTRAALAVAKGQPIAAWNSRLPPGLEAGLAARGGTLLRVEDGFIRSRGLGSGFLPPASIIVDASGIYYDPRQPSDLESILAQSVFDTALRARARALIERLNQRGITKYQAGGAAFRLAAPAGVRRILVPGQVADDLSVRLGAGAVRSNLGLLEHARAAHPNAWLVYKPHPDVEAGHRPGAVAETDARRFADQVVREGAMSALISAVDEVYTMTSLAGFEALLRGREVTVLGQPFYAGWGLTHDLAPLARRTRRLHLEELAAGVLILYPRYLDPQSGLPCGPELLIDRLDQPELWRPSRLMRLRSLQGNLNRRLQIR